MTARSSCILLLCVVVVPSVLGAATPPHLHPVNAASDGDWLHDKALQAKTAKRAEGAKPAKRVILNLDLDPKDRWTEIAKQYSYIAPAVLAYFAEYIPKWLIPEIEIVAASVASYFPADYAAEMRAIAPVLGLSLGDVVILNLIYQIEGIGVNCSNYNNTGPCPAPSKPKGPGLCTSIVARNADSGQIFHARNLDWSIPSALRTLMVDVEYQRGGKTLFIGSQPVGYMGILHGVRPGGWSFSLDARNHGGKVLENLLWSMLRHSLTPTQHARQVMESVDSYDEAVAALSNSPIINAAYYIVGGMKPTEAAVITRERHAAVDVWTIKPPPPPCKTNPTTTTGGKPTSGASVSNLNCSSAGGDEFFLLQTNYDHTAEAPPWDDRRTPGYAHMKTLGAKDVGFNGLFYVLTQWPTFNHHTDFSASFSAANVSHYQTYLWPEVQPEPLSTRRQLN